MKKLGVMLIGSLMLSLAAAPAQARLSTSLVERAPARGSTHVIRIPRTSTGPLSDEERYAIREAIAKEAANFRGGDVVVISATAAIVVLLGVIIVILLV